MPSGTRAALGSPRKARELLEMSFLDVRCHLLETAAALDRIERAEGSADATRDPRMRKILIALDILKSGGTDRAERFLTLFSED
jgi:hypothetical protein